MKTRMYYKMALVTVFLLTSCLLSASSLLAYTGTITDNFKGASLNPHLWEEWFTGTGPTISQTSGQLQINIPANSQPGPPYNQWIAAVKSKFILIGDFDVQVDFSLLTWPINDAISVVLNAFLAPPAGLPNGYVSRLGAATGGINECYYSGLMNSVTFNATGDLSGTLRMVRIANLVTTLYWDQASKNWVLLGSVADPAFWKGTPIYLLATSGTSFGKKAALVAFNNFRVQYTQVFWNMPPILDLLLLSD